MRARAGWVGAILLLGILLGGSAWWLWSARSHVLLEATLPALSEGTDFVFTVSEPGEVLLRVELPADCTQETSATVRSLHVALDPEWRYEPSPVGPQPLVVRHGRPDLGRVRLERAGAYVLRIEPIPMAMGNDMPERLLRVRIRRP